VAVHRVGWAYYDHKARPRAKEIREYVIATWPGTDVAMWSKMDLVTADIAKGDIEAAETGAQELINDYAWNEQIAQAVRAVGDHWGAFKKYGNARAAYSVVLERWPTDEFAMWAAKGQIMCDIREMKSLDILEDIDKFIADYREHPDLGKALYAIGKGCEKLPKQGLGYHKAKQVYEKIVEAFPESELAEKAAFDRLKAECVVFFSDANDEAGFRALDEVIAKCPADENVGKIVYEIGKRCENIFRYYTACEVYRKLQVVRPGSKEAAEGLKDMEDLGVILPTVEALSVGEFDAETEAILADWDGVWPAPKEVCRIGEEYYNAGFWYENAGDIERADEQLRKALETWEQLTAKAPDDEWTADARHYSAIILGRLGEYQRAIEHWEILKEKWPQHRGVSEAEFHIAQRLKYANNPALAEAVKEARRRMIEENGK